MDRRQFLKGVAAGGLASSVLSPLMAGGGSGERPNIVLIMCDDLGWQEVGCMGQEKIKTPNIDRLAAQGMLFNQFYSGCAVCAPSRCCLMTGKHGGHAYVRSNMEIRKKGPIFGGQLPLPAEEQTIAETLKAAGYTTGCFGKWGLGAPGTTGDPLDQGFDRFYGFNCQRHAHNLYPRYLVNDRENEELPGNTRGVTGEIYGPQRIADEMLKFVRENQDDPFFLYYPTLIPHLPLQVPDEYLEQYKGKWPEEPYEGRSYLPHPTPRACYAAMISFMDAQVGRLMKLLQELGLEENTFVFFTSDNGTTHLGQQADYEFFNSVGPLRGLKGRLYEGGIRVPTVARWPGRIEPGTRTDHIAANYDLPATLAEVAGVEFQGNGDGLSFVPEMLGRQEDQKAAPFLFWDFPGYGGQIAVRMGKWKGIKTGLRRNPDAPLELYNLENDIGETNNVVDKHPEVAKKIESLMLSERTVPEVEKFRFGKYD